MLNPAKKTLTILLLLSALVSFAACSEKDSLHPASPTASLNAQDQASGKNDGVCPEQIENDWRVTSTQATDWTFTIAKDAFDQLFVAEQRDGVCLGDVKYTAVCNASRLYFTAQFNDHEVRRIYTTEKNESGEIQVRISETSRAIGSKDDYSPASEYMAIPFSTESN